MIQLTRLNKELLMVNSDLIKFVERAPDTVITLVAGEKIVVRESPEEVLAKIINFRRSVASNEVNGSPLPARASAGPESNPLSSERV
jgi:flagellar protein FlbD